jgi:hypothetical protein
MSHLDFRNPEPNQEEYVEEDQEDEEEEDAEEEEEGEEQEEVEKNVPWVARCEHNKVCVKLATRELQNNHTWLLFRFAHLPGLKPSRVRLDLARALAGPDAEQVGNLNPVEEKQIVDLETAVPDAQVQFCQWEGARMALDELHVTEVACHNNTASKRFRPVRTARAFRVRGRSQGAVLVLAYTVDLAVWFDATALLQRNYQFLRLGWGLCPPCVRPFLSLPLDTELG